MEIIQQYIEYIKCKKKLSENTICSYYTDIKKYLDYLKCENIKLEEVAEYDIINFLVNLEKQNNSVATVSRVTSSVKSFHDYLFLNRISETNPANNIKKPKIKRESVEILTEEEIEALLKFPDLTSPKKMRDKAIFETLYGTGIRVSELVELNLQDVDLQIDYLYCNTGKNQRVIPLCEITKNYLEKYINNFEIRMLPPTTQEELDRQNNISAKIGIVNDLINIIDNKIDDAATKLNITKILISPLINDSNVLSEIDNYLEKKVRVSRGKKTILRNLMLYNP